MASKPTTLLQKLCEIILNSLDISKSITVSDNICNIFLGKELMEKYLKRKCRWEHYPQLSFKHIVKLLLVLELLQKYNKF